jgi:hypothetical protein
MNDARASHINAKQGTIKAVNTSKLDEVYAYGPIVLQCATMVLQQNYNNNNREISKTFVGPKYKG